MRIPRLDKGYRNLKRYRQIVSVLFRYGFSEVLDRIDVARRLSLGRRVLKREISGERPYAVRMRMAMEELGPTFIKLGQVLSMRSFLIPPELARELSKLQDRVSPVGFDAIKPVIEAELGGKIESFFSYFESSPVASASLAQAYHAVTKDGSDVVVKVQRPNIKDIVEADIDILMDLAQLIERHVPEISQYDPVGIVEELARTTRRELDFYNEGRNAEIFARNFARERMIHVPKVFWELTTSHVITLERIKGIKISDLEALDREGIDRRALAKVGARAILKQIFEDGFFHADPHPGNLFALKGGIIAPVDFGMTGRLDDELMGKLVLLYIGFIEKDTELIIRFLEDEGIVDGSKDLRELRTDLSDMIDKYHGVALGLINMESLLEDASFIIRKYRLRIPPSFMPLGRALGTYEEVGRMRAPEFDMISETRPYVRRLIGEAGFQQDQEGHPEDRPGSV